MDIKDKYVSNLAPYIYAWSVWKKVEFKYQKFYIIFSTIHGRSFRRYFLSTRGKKQTLYVRQPGYLHLNNSY